MTAVIGVGGEPASGKSAVVRALLRSLGRGVPFRAGLVKGTLHRGGRVAVLGDYGATAGAYPGTDRLSMAVQPAALDYVRRSTLGVGPRVIVFEGDRLFNASFLRACLRLAPASRFAMLVASDAVRAGRRCDRSDGKGKAFLRGRATKYWRIRRDFAAVVALTNESPADLDAACALVSGWVDDAAPPKA